MFLFFVINNRHGILKRREMCIRDRDKLGEEFLKPITTGASISVNGTLVQSQGKGQNVEIQATEIEIYGSADPNTYPLQKKGHSMEFLREIAQDVYKRQLS